MKNAKTGYIASVYMAQKSILGFRVQCKTSHSITCPNFGRIGDRRDIESVVVSSARPHERMIANLPPSCTTSKPKLQNPTIHCPIESHPHTAAQNSSATLHLSEITSSVKNPHLKIPSCEKLSTELLSAHRTLKSILGFRV